jgi:hypothetical protein
VVKGENNKRKKKEQRGEEESGSKNEIIVKRRRHVGLFKGKVRTVSSGNGVTYFYHFTPASWISTDLCSKHRHFPGCSLRVPELTK